MPSDQNPPRGPLQIGVGPIPEATLNKTEVLIDIPDQTINVGVTFRFNQTEKYFIYVLLPYQALNVGAYATYEGNNYPQIPVEGKITVGSFSTNLLFNCTLGSSIVNASLDINSSFPWHFASDMKTELTIGVAIRVHENLIAVGDFFGSSQSAIFTFFGTNNGIWSQDMLAFMYPPNSQMTLNEPFTVSLRLPTSSLYSDSQPGPIEYYVRQDQRWIMFSLDFLGGQYAQTLVCNFVNPTRQTLRELVIFSAGVSSAFFVSLLLEAVKSFSERRNTKQTLQESPTASPPGDNMPKGRISLEDVVLALWGVVLAFTVQVLYDIFGGPFYTSIMPRILWGILIAIILTFLLLSYVKRLRTRDEKKNKASKLLRLVVSKWFCYGLIAFLLAILLFADFRASYYFNNDFAVRFMPTLIGIVFTFTIFIVFFDVREELEWKEVEDRVKKRIRSEIFNLFSLLTGFCEVDSVLVGDAHDRETWKKLERKQLKQMTEKVVLNEPLIKDLSEKKGLALDYVSLFESIRLRISEIEAKYGRFLNPKLRTSLMDIQDYLGDLRFELKVSGANKETMPPVIEKIVKEISSIRASGIDTGF